MDSVDFVAIGLMVARGIGLTAQLLAALRGAVLMVAVGRLVVVVIVVVAVVIVVVIVVIVVVVVVVVVVALNAMVEPLVA